MDNSQRIVVGLIISGQTEFSAATDSDPPGNVNSRLDYLREREYSWISIRNPIVAASAVAGTSDRAGSCSYLNTA